MSPARQTFYGWAVIVTTLVTVVCVAYCYDHRTRVLAEQSLSSRQKIRVVEDAPQGRMFDDTFIYRAEFYHDGVLAAAASISYASFSAKEASIEPGEKSTIVKLEGLPKFEFSYGRQLGEWKILADELP